jgi:hypothetical protein
MKGSMTGCSWICEYSVTLCLTSHVIIALRILLSIPLTFLHIHLINSRFLTVNISNAPCQYFNSHHREIVLAFLLFAYCLYLFALLVLSFTRIVALTPPFKFLFFVTLFCFVAVMSGLFLGYFYPLATSAVVFLSFYAILNFYVWTLAFAYAPLGSEDG